MVSRSPFGVRLITTSNPSPLVTESATTELDSGERFSLPEVKPEPIARDLDARRLVSFVVPVLNEHESLQTLHQQIQSTCDQHDVRCEIIFVDDGSSDTSWLVIEELSQNHSRTGGIRFRRNFGKAAALDAGFSACRGAIVITMDADLQDDPKEIPRFLSAIDGGLDVVSGWKKIRHDPWHKTLPSRVFNGLVSRMTGVRLHDHNCGFKAYRREIFDEVKLYGERHRFVPVLAAAQGWTVGEIEVRHHARPFGRSKYGVSRLLKGFLDLLTIYLLTGFSGRPFHLIGTLGMFCFAAGAAGMSYLSVMWCVSRMFETMPDVHLHEKAIFYFCILAVLLGAQCLLAGLLAELIVSQSGRDSKRYSIADRLLPDSQLEN